MTATGRSFGGPVPTSYTMSTTVPNTPFTKTHNNLALPHGNTKHVFFVKAGKFYFWIFQLARLLPESRRAVLSSVVCFLTLTDPFSLISL